MSSMYPLLFRPVYKDYLWGGDRILRKYRRQAQPGVFAESWEVSDRAEGMSRVENGPLAGRTLEQLVDEFGTLILGSRVESGRFPLLIKLIDSKQDLSLQVHPNDQNCHLTGGEPKTEMWYILDADPGSRVYSGFKQPLSDAEFSAQVQSGDIEKNMNEIPVSPGDAVFTPGGRVHAIGKGCLILEVQQNSNTTYRIYDWGRIDADGKPRDLHLEQARQVIEWNEDTPSLVKPVLEGESDGSKVWTILSTPYFVMRRIDIEGEWDLVHDGQSFRVLFSADEDLTLFAGEGGETRLPYGRSCLVPADIQKVNIRPASGHGSLIEVFIP